MSQDELHQLSRRLRLRTLALHHQGRAGHIGCSLSCIELLAASLVLEKRSEETFILSKGHAAMALYVCLHERGELSDSDLEQVYRDGTRLPAHPAPCQWPSIPFALGSLGHGLPIATGIAYSDSLLKRNLCTFVVMSDGETNAGTTWESAHFAVRHHLDRLVVLVDRNQLQGFGPTREVLGDTADPAQWQSLGFEVKEMDGHNLPALVEQLRVFRSRTNGRPKALIANTVKGFGVSFMENRLEWHYLPMSEDEYRAAQEEVHARKIF